MCQQKENVCFSFFLKFENPAVWRMKYKMSKSVISFTCRDETSHVGQTSPTERPVMRKRCFVIVAAVIIPILVSRLFCSGQNQRCKSSSAREFCGFAYLQFYPYYSVFDLFSFIQFLYFLTSNPPLKCTKSMDPTFFSHSAMEPKNLK